ncbi:MAG: hypothetical protein M5U19_17475 [Microthrixaceae bacterium]|nr:hypothetical protein [Microthrixaceae bacterium]
MSVEEVLEATGFELVVPEQVPETRGPTPEELEQLERIDPQGLRFREVAGS